MADDALYIGMDVEKIVVSRRPLTMRSGRARRRRFGSVVEVAPVPPSGRGALERTRMLSQVTLVMVIVCAILAAVGIPWWVPAAGSAALLAAGWLHQARAARTGLFAVPAGDDVHVLRTPPERDAFRKALHVTRRIRKTWPKLAPMIEPGDADRALSRALEDLAEVLARRQQLRRVRDELAEVDERELPVDSPAVQALRTQRERVDRLWQETGAVANQLLASINAVARAGDDWLREQHIAATADRVERAVSQLTVAGAGRVIDAGPDLAERTAAVLDAYRELAVR